MRQLKIVKLIKLNCFLVRFKRITQACIISNSQTIKACNLSPPYVINNKDHTKEIAGALARIPGNPEKVLSSWAL